MGLGLFIGTENVFHSTWGHYAPKKNVSYNGYITLFNSQHGEDGGSGIKILEYVFDGLDGGPYLHDAIINYFYNPDRFHIIGDDYNKYKLELVPNVIQIEDGWIYEMEVTFRNYRFYHKKPKKVYQLKGFRDANCR